MKRRRRTRTFLYLALLVAINAGAGWYVWRDWQDEGYSRLLCWQQNLIIAEQLKPEDALHFCELARQQAADLGSDSIALAISLQQEAQCQLALGNLDQARARAITAVELFTKLQSNPEFSTIAPKHLIDCQIIVAKTTCHTKCNEISRFLKSAQAAVLNRLSDDNSQWSRNKLIDILQVQSEIEDELGNKERAALCLKQLQALLQAPAGLYAKYFRDLLARPTFYTDLFSINSSERLVDQLVRRNRAAEATRYANSLLEYIQRGTRFPEYELLMTRIALAHSEMHNSAKAAITIEELLTVLPGYGGTPREVASFWLRAVDFWLLDKKYARAGIDLEQAISYVRHHANQSSDWDRILISAASYECVVARSTQLPAHKFASDLLELEDIAQSQAHTSLLQNAPICFAVIGAIETENDSLRILNSLGKQQFQNEAHLAGSLAQLACASGAKKFTRSYSQSIAMLALLCQKGIRPDKALLRATVLAWPYNARLETPEVLGPVSLQLQELVPEAVWQLASCRAQNLMWLGRLSEAEQLIDQCRVKAHNQPDFDFWYQCYLDQCLQKAIQEPGTVDSNWRANLLSRYEEHAGRVRQLHGAESSEYGYYLWQRAHAYGLQGNARAALQDLDRCEEIGKKRKTAYTLQQVRAKKKEIVNQNSDLS